MGRQRAEPAQPQDRERSLAYLAERLRGVDHPQVRARLARLDAILTSTVAADLDRYPETLVPLRSAFDCLRTTVLDHLAQTESDVLPALIAADATSTAAIDDPRFARASRILAARHPVLQAGLARLRTVTRGYAPPDDAGPGLRRLYWELAALERDLDARLQRERELLLPRVPPPPSSRAGDI